MWLIHCCKMLFIRLFNYPMITSSFGLTLLFIVQNRSPAQKLLSTWISKDQFNACTEVNSVFLLIHHVLLLRQKWIISWFFFQCYPLMFPVINTFAAGIIYFFAVIAIIIVSHTVSIIVTFWCSHMFAHTHTYRHPCGCDVNQFG